MRILLPLILALLGIGGGVAAGLALRPEPEPPTEEELLAIAKQKEAAKVVDPDNPPAGKAFIKLNNQFVVPVIKEGRVSSLVVLSISLEVNQGDSQPVFSKEPKLRDIFLQVLFDHANEGGFDGAFTQSNQMNRLRSQLQYASKEATQDLITDVLITEIVRQDLH